MVGLTMVGLTMVGSTLAGSTVVVGTVVPPALYLLVPRPRAPVGSGGPGAVPSAVMSPRYASLYFCCAIEGQDNELITLELIHRYVELLDKYFGSVCELDIIFNFEKAYFILDEFVMGGEIQDTSKKSVLKAIEQADLLQEEDESPRSVLEEMGLA
ncbi:AP-1 complex subunit sigma-1A-like [Cinclus cinclus]|uniref:AP-1 complex subunit sigma-1A-like n=1 Tax=Cinclus cinclus TaxID=127875 RepID=UPI002E0FC28E